MGDRALWVGYSVYFYDEDNGKNYFEDFLYEIKEYPNLRSYVFHFFSLMRLIRDGKGIEYEMVTNDEFKKLKSNYHLWEYRIKDGKSKRLVRIYFGVIEEFKEIVILNAHFKSSDKDQEREIRTAEERFKRRKQILAQLRMIKGKGRTKP